MRVFLDACCLYAAGRSIDGGSAKIIRSSHDKNFTILLTMMVITEAKRKLIKHLGEETFTGLISMIRNASRELISEPSQDEMKPFERITVEKDLHVLAGAIKGNADVLVTLDRKHLLKAAVRTAFPIPIMDTKEFWKAIKEGDTD
jgi:predicted nucleic acid-binding protein